MSSQPQATVAENSDVPAIEATFKQLSDLFLLAEDGYLPVLGFLPEREVKNVCEKMHLTTGEPWSIPIIFPVDDVQAQLAKRSEKLLLRDASGAPAGLLHVSEVFKIDKAHYAKHIFRTEDSAHPGVQWLAESGDYSIAGEIETFPDWKFDIPGDLAFSPRQVKAEVEKRGWKRVAAFQTRNPIHRAHEYCTKIALELSDGLVIHPLLGETKPDDIPVDVRLACYKVLIENYYSAAHTLLAGFPAWMRYAGPREAVFHAQVRKNYGITHFIVGRDHAGVGNYYGPFDAQEIFSEFQPGELGIEPLFFNLVFYSTRCAGMASPKTSPGGDDEQIFLSGTVVRQMLKEGKMLPEEFTRPEVAKILMEAEQNQ